MGRQRKKHNWKAREQNTAALKPAEDRKSEVLLELDSKVFTSPYLLLFVYKAINVILSC